MHTLLGLTFVLFLTEISQQVEELSLAIVAWQRKTYKCT